MAGANTVFDQIPASIRKPGKYFEFNTKLAVRTLPTNAQNVLLVAPMAASGTTATPGEPCMVYSDVEAATLFGSASAAYRMARAAIVANPYVRLSVIGLRDEPADYAAALAGVFGGDYQIIAIADNSANGLTILRDHLDAISHPMEQRGAIGVSAMTGGLATATTLAESLNAGRITIAWLNGTDTPADEVAAAYAAVIASEEDPARPLNTLWLKEVAVNPVSKQAGRTEQEVALANGITPLEIGPGEKVQIVRAISTYTKSASGADDVSLLDITTIRTLDYVRKACKERIELRFPREKKTKRVAAKVRSELLDVLYKLEQLEIVEAVEDNKAALIVEDDLQDVNRLNAAIPVDVVNGLHVFAGRIDLLL